MSEVAKKSFDEALEAAIKQVEEAEDGYPELLEQLEKLRGMDKDEISDDDVRKTRIQINNALEIRGRIPRDFSEEDDSDEGPSPLAEFENELIELEPKGS